MSAAPATSAPVGAPKDEPKAFTPGLTSAILVPSTAPALTPATYAKLGAQLGGRDKLMRFVQYASRALVFQLGEKTANGAKLQALQKALGLHRKAFKLGMFLDEFLKFVEAVSKQGDETDRLLTIAQRFAMTFFVALDNILYLLDIKVLSADSFDKATIKMKSYQLRLFAAVVAAIQCVLALAKQQKTVEKTANDASATPEALIKAREKQGQNVWKTVKNLFDVVTYGNSAEVFLGVFGKGLDDGVIGTMGAVSAYCGLVEIWCSGKV